VLLGTSPFTYQSDQVDELSIQFTCVLYVAVHTSDTRNGAAEVYTQRGAAEWTFDGSGGIDAAGVYTCSAGNTGSSMFTPITNGAVVPVTTGTSVNQMFSGEQWTTHSED